MKVDSLLLIALHESEGVGWKTINRIISNGERMRGCCLMMRMIGGHVVCLSKSEQTGQGLSFRCRKKAD